MYRYSLGPMTDIKSILSLVFVRIHNNINMIGTLINRDARRRRESVHVL